MKIAADMSWRQSMEFTSLSREFGVQSREFRAQPSEFASKPSDLNSEGLLGRGGVS